MQLDRLSLRMGDTTLILAQRLAELCGKGPSLEEDMSLTNTALDLLGQSRLWLSLASELEGAGRDEDDLAFHRDAHEFRNYLLVEQPNGNYAETIARQFLFDAWHVLYLDALTCCDSLPRHAEIAAKSVKEARYHHRRSRDLLIRLGDGTDYSHNLMQNALDNLWQYTGELFKTETDCNQPDPSAIYPKWLEDMRAACQGATLTLPPEDAWMQSGGISGRHSEYLGYILAEMQVLPRAHLGAKW